MPGRINVGVVLESQLHSGGGFQQAFSTLLLLDEKGEKDKLTNFTYFTSVKENLKILKEHNIKCHYLSFFKLRKIMSSISKFLSGRLTSLTKIINFFAVDKYFEKKNIDLLYFLEPSNIPVYLEKLNYIYTLWDQCHRDHMEFPEVRENWEFSKREKKFQLALPKASAIFVDSEKSKKSAVFRYRIDETRVRVLPFLPSKLIVEKKTSQHLPKSLFERPFIFYPAQYWAHKNHLTLLKAIKILKDRGIEVMCVLTGSDKGNLENIHKYINHLGLAKDVIVLGFVESEIISNLYQKCNMVVMPSYFGPTNLPPLEAMVFRKPVIYPSINIENNDFSKFVVPFYISDFVDLSEKILGVLRKDIPLEAKYKAGQIYLKKYNSNYFWNGVLAEIKSFERKYSIWNSLSM